jgi:small neutral amino acid transporter SnatA (MarC family)
MNANDIEMFLIMILSGAVNMMLFIYVGNSILNFFKTPAPALTPRSGRASYVNDEFTG